MRKTLIDINPYGAAEDMHAEPDFEASYFARLYNEGARDVRLIKETDGKIELDQLQDTVRLKIKKVLGGNQWNVYQNLRTMKASNFDAHFGISNGEVARKILYVPGIKGKIDLKNPDGIGEPVWNKNLKDTDVFISSSPPLIGGEAYWKGLRDALNRDKSTGIIWNPQRKQIAPGGLERETLKALKGRVKILQVNEAEAKDMVSSYLHRDGNIDRLQDLVQSEWTVVTKGAEGIRGYVGGRKYDEPIYERDGYVRASLGEDYCEGMDVGCGDVVMATLITQQNYPLQRALRFAALMGKMQFHHAGSNLSTVSNFNSHLSAADL